MLSLSLCLSLFCSLCLSLSSLHRTKAIVINGLNDWTIRIQICCNFLQSIGNLTMPPLSLCLSLFCSLSSLHRKKGIVINGLNDWTIRKQICCTSRLSVQQNKVLEAEKESLDFIVGLRVFSLEFSISYGTG